MGEPALDLFSRPTETEIGMARAVDAAEGHERYFRRLRAAVRRDYRHRTITTDQVWATMDRHDLPLPADLHPNALGSFFTAWPEAEEVYIGDGALRQRARRRSDRPGSHGNLLALWRIT